MDTEPNYLIDQVDYCFPTARQLKKLLFQGAAINYQRPNDGYSALMLAVEKQYDRISEYLLKQGANPLLSNHQNKIASELVPSHYSVYPILKDSELLFATMNNDLPAVKSIIEAGAQIDFQGPGDYTALMIASEQNLIDIVDYLLLEGANLWLTRTDGKNALDLASDSVRVHLHNYAGNLNKIITKNDQTTQRKNCPSFFSNFGSGVKLNFRTNDAQLKEELNFTQAKEKQNPIQSNIINYQSQEDGYTPLMLAVDRDDQPLVAFLLQYGANPLLKNYYDEKASDIALSYSPIQQLLQQKIHNQGEEVIDVSKYNNALNELLKQLSATE